LFNSSLGQAKLESSKNHELARGYLYPKYEIPIHYVHAGCRMEPAQFQMFKLMKSILVLAKVVINRLLAAM
jgi:hypothetical protein